MDERRQRQRAQGRELVVDEEMKIINFYRWCGMGIVWMFWPIENINKNVNAILWNFKNMRNLLKFKLQLEDITVVTCHPHVPPPKLQFNYNLSAQPSIKFVLITDGVNSTFQSTSTHTTARHLHSFTLSLPHNQIMLDRNLKPIQPKKEHFVEF